MATPKTSQPPNYSSSLILLTSLFFVWGLITSLNDILVPHLKAIFTLNYVRAMLVQFCFFGAYFVTSFPAGHLVERIGYRRGIVGGLAVAGLGCIGFLPAASASSYPLFLTSLFVLAAGITLLQVAANPCVALLGTPETSASRLNLTQAFNSLGTTIGPFIGAVTILPETGAGPGGIAHEIEAVRPPYFVLAVLLALMAAGFSRFRLPEIGTVGADAANAANTYTPESLWKQPQLVLGVIAIFVYVGAEVSIGSVLVNFMTQPAIGGLSEDNAGKLLSLYWGGAMVGRFIGSWVLSKVPAGRVLACNALGAMLLLFVTANATGATAMWSVLAVGLCNSIMFPTIFTLGIADLGTRTSEGSGALCMAIVGGALLPVLMGFVADHAGLQPAFYVPLVCYAYIAHYGWRGHALR